MQGIFISYRREDTSGFARSLFQSLESHFGAEQVFIDVEAIELGVDFVDVLDKSLADCAVLLVLIGKEWADCTDEHGARRIMDPNDFVHIEVATALKRSDVRVIPVLVRGATMPRTQELPEDLKSLTRRQAFELRHDRWSMDVKVLIEALETRVGKPESKEPAPEPDGTRVETEKPREEKPSVRATGSNMLTRTLAITGGVLLVLIAIGLLVEEEPVPVYDPPGPRTIAIDPEPNRSPSAPTQAQEALVYEAQELLSEMGYNPGNSDGVAGRQTTQAVRAFQQDLGMPVNGRISEDLIDTLHAALAESDEDTPNGNLTGFWIDSEGIHYQVMQQGNQLQLEAYDAYGNLAGGGEGRINGNRVEYSMMVRDGTRYVGQGVLTPNGSRLDYRSTNTLSGLQESGSLYRQ